jgi:O-antigen biosynthesis protein
VSGIAVTVVTRTDGDQPYRRSHAARGQRSDWEHLLTPAATLGELAAQARGRWVVFADDGDELAHQAFDEVIQTGADHPAAELIYADHDIIEPNGRRHSAAYKPDFSPERLRHINYMAPGLIAIRRSTLDDLGELAYDGPSHGLLLRIVERGAPVVHLSEVLYHRAAHHPPVEADPSAAERHLARLGIDSAATHGPSREVLRINRTLSDTPPVSVIIPTRGSTGVVWGRTRRFVVDAVHSMVTRSSYTNLEFVVVADADADPEIRRHLQRVAGDRLTWVEFVGDFNFSAKINLGAHAAAGDLLLMLNDDTELLDFDSVGAMVALLTDGDTTSGAVGAVGAKLLYSDGTLQHGGHVYHHQFMHACIGWRGDTPGPNSVLATPRECSGVTAAALMTTRAVFDEVGGMPEALPLHFNDVAFCLAIRDTGRRIIWTPDARWYHFEGKTRRREATMDEYRYVEERWPLVIHNDPYYNTNLASSRSDWVADATSVSVG